MAATTLTYCTNVHPSETLEEMLASLERYSVPLARELRRDGILEGPVFPLGLYWSAATVKELLRPERWRRFRDWLLEHGIGVATLNCFPYGGFHSDSLKEQVFAPGWHEPERAEYTIHAARLLAKLLPERASASISTLSGTWKAWRDDAPVRDQIARQWGRVAFELHRIFQDTGREVLLAIEPEPGSTLEATGEAVELFESRVFSGPGQESLRALGLSAAEAERVARCFLTLCYDACHQAVEFEEPGGSLKALESAGIRVGKVQVSSALRLRREDPGSSEALRSALPAYAEPRYLHQVLVRERTGNVRAYADLPLGLQALPELDWSELRCHFHVPVHRRRLGPLETTREHWEQVVGFWPAGRVPLLEIETYTFGAAPAPSGAASWGDLVESLRAEFRAVTEVLGSRGGTPEDSSQDV